VGFDERREHRILGWSIAVLLILGLLAMLAKGANGPADPFVKTGATATSVSQIAPSAVRVPVAGFGEAVIRIGSGPELCALLAATQAQRNQGLMRRTTLSGHVGMLFTFPGITTETFYMKDTLIPLSIAFFDSNGRFVSATDMVPCPPNVDPCPTYAAARPYRFALEVPRGQLGGVGVGPGSVLGIGGTCT